MFVDTAATVSVTDDHGNSIEVRAKMDLGTKTAVVIRFRQLDANPLAAQAAYELALLEHNVVGWSGPAFEGVECSRANIRRLDPDQPLLTSVLAKINELNTARTEPPEPPEKN